MIRLPQRESKLLVAVHGWLGATLGLLLYAVIVTGAAAVFAQEVRNWSAGEIGSQEPFARPIDAIARQLAAETPAHFVDELSMRGRPGGSLFLFFHAHEPINGEVKERGILYEIGPDGQKRSQKEGLGEDLLGHDETGALGKFLVELHVRLHLPKPWGLLVTGILGLAMLAAAVSGLLMHRHLFRDLFTLRGGRDRVVALRDWHTVAATWTLPHAFILAFTGAFFSFAISFGIPLLAKVAFQGDRTAMIESLGTPKPAEDATPRMGANLDRIFADARQRAGSPITFVSLDHWGRADARLVLFHAPPDGRLRGPSYAYNGATGAFETERHGLGRQPSVGSSILALMGPLHFGTFAGWASKAVWFALGIATAYVTLSGLRLWVRRREGSYGWAAFGRLTSWVGAGLPLALVSAAVGYFAGQLLSAVVAGMWAGFSIAALVALIAALRWSPERASRILFATMAALMLLLPLLRVATGGPGWASILAAGNTPVLALDVLLIIGGLAVLAPWARPVWDRVTGRDPALSHPQPAE